MAGAVLSTLKWVLFVPVVLTNRMAIKITGKWRFLTPVLLLLLVACSANPPSPVLAFFFDLPAPGQTVSNEMPPRQPRRKEFQPPPPPGPSKEFVAAVENLIKAGPPPNWPELFKQLPKDDEDNIDWMAALESKLITPKGVIDDKDKDPGRTVDDDIELATSGKPNRMVVFSHSTHTQWLTCNNCHNAIFKREAGSATITMDDIDEGKYCGVCHDKVALAQPSGCKGCHKPIKKS